MEKSWTAIADALEQVARLRRAEWGCGFPPFDCVPNDDLDFVVSAWCRVMADNLNAPIDPPAVVRPWILVRLVTASVQARVEQAAGTGVPDFSPDTVSNMLIAGWHHLLREQWAMMVTQDLPEVD